MAIHFYINGTDGAKDGEELSNGDLSYPVVADGMYPAAGTTVYKELPVIHVRCDPGEVQYLVLIEIRGTNADNYWVLENLTGGGDAARCLQGYDYGYGSNSNFGDKTGSRGNYKHVGYIIRRLADVNVPLYLMCSASGSETNSPDTSCKIYARGIQINGAS